MTWWRAGMPSHSRSSSAPSLPHTQAVAHDVVGRRTPTAESSSPLRALKVEDLPLPGRAGERDDGVVGGELEATGRAGGDGGGVVHDRVVDPAARACGGTFEAVDPGADVRAPGDQLLGPFEQRRHDSLTVRWCGAAAHQP